MEKKQQRDPASAVAKGVGNTLAHVQDLADLLIGWGFRTLRKVGETHEEKQQNRTVMSRLLHVGRRSLGFLGTLGQSYYDRYEELKRKRHRSGDS